MVRHARIVHNLEHSTTVARKTCAPFIATRNVESMRRSPEIERLTGKAETQRHFIFGTTANQRKVLRTRWLAHEYIRLCPNVYARLEYFNELNPVERTLHLIRTLALKNPRRVFGGLSAALVLGLECPWRLSEMGHAQIATEESITRQPAGAVEKIHVHPLTFIVHDGIRVTPPAQTLVDCGLRYPYAQALGIFDSALRMGLVTTDAIERTCQRSNNCEPMHRLLRDADPKSENGGESFCRAVILDSGFAKPELQHEFRDPANPTHIFRTDFLWLCNGNAVVLEYDGMEKYTNQHMTNGRSTRRVVYDERRREDALHRAGVASILRTDYQEVTSRKPLIQKLISNGIPMQPSLN
ncbi:CTP synthase [Bifidobacterium sp. ESL0764]|uniref:CTP synthase n=1 Tax=Bifidobacterium sp. ESL0764 TaxID=2983228 RepID=UPI0023F98185|nr:CTP synthase [Bifidobacterium sp. ESL0764]WEV65858.1 CTP synthase [Bifidobacterium sp. ESL0764]